MPKRKKRRKTPEKLVPGLKRNKLTVVSYNVKERSIKCVCECGNTTIILQSHFGRNVSCGCVKGGPSKKHGMCRHALYGIWQAMKNRCNNPNVVGYRDYGGRGITVCERRLESFENFRDDMLLTWAPGLSLERKDNDGPYSPGNCVWATVKEQSRNKRNNIVGVVFGDLLTLPEAVEQYGAVSRKTAWGRIKNGWDFQEAVTTPLQVKAS